MSVHDRVVATRTYSQAHALAEALAQRAQQTWLFGAVQQRLPQAAVDTGERPPGLKGPAPASCSRAARRLHQALRPPNLPCNVSHWRAPAAHPTTAAATPYFNSLVQHLQPITA